MKNCELVEGFRLSPKWCAESSMPISTIILFSFLEAQKGENESLAAAQAMLVDCIVETATRSLGHTQEERRTPHHHHKEEEGDTVAHNIGHQRKRNAQASVKEINNKRKGKAK